METVGNTVDTNQGKKKLNTVHARQRANKLKLEVTKRGITDKNLTNTGEAQYGGQNTANFN